MEKEVSIHVIVGWVAVLAEKKPVPRDLRHYTPLGKVSPAMINFATVGQYHEGNWSGFINVCQFGSGPGVPSMKISEITLRKLAYVVHRLSV